MCVRERERESSDRGSEGGRRAESRDLAREREDEGSMEKRMRVR